MKEEIKKVEEKNQENTKKLLSQIRDEGMLCLVLIFCIYIMLVNISISTKFIVFLILPKSIDF